MIYDVSHYFFLTLHKFVTSIDILHYEFLDRYDTIIIYINLIEDLIDDFKTNFIVYYIFLVDKELVKFVSSNASVLIDINYIELSHQLLTHIVLQASLFDTLVYRIGIREALSHILVIDKRRLVR